MWTLGDFSGSIGAIISSSILPRVPYPKVKMSSSTFSLSDLKVPILSKPIWSIQKFESFDLSKLPIAIYCNPSTLKFLAFDEKFYNF